MNSPEQIVSFLIECLDTSGIRYMIAGSFASNLYGVPRATQDADIVIEITPSTLSQLQRSIGSDYYFPEESARDAVNHGGMFNVVHMHTGFKVDFIVRRNRPFSAEEFKRRQQADFEGKPCWFSSPEDSILTKLEWAKKGESERQFRDAAGIAKVQKSSLDLDYLRLWAPSLGVSDLLDRLLAELEDT
jgi:hypothetical protein